jgi:hypothetical protein
MRVALVALLGAVGIAPWAGCTVGSGVGSAVGTLFDVGCNGNDPMLLPKPFSLNPTFFAGEPIEDVCPKPPGDCSGPRMNRLLIRMQRNGNREEVNDVLFFDILNSRKVAQCVRGQTLHGVPTWDTRLVTGADGLPIPGLPWCDWNWIDATADGGAADAGAADAGAPDAGAPSTADAGATDGGIVAPVMMTAPYARINLSTQDYVQASLAPLYSCVEARSVGVAVPPGSWIAFQSFGQAIQNDIPNPEDRGDITDDFSVDFGQHLQASFHLILGDQAVEYAIKTRALVPDPRIGGTLDGSFDFDLDRGRAAQPFP